MKNRSVLMVVAAISAAVALFPGASFASKQQPPAPEKMKKLSFPNYNEFSLKNGLDVVVVEHHEQPVATAYFMFRCGSSLDPQGKSSLASFVGQLLNKGAKGMDSKQLAEWIESYGGEYSVGTSNDFTYVGVDILSEYIDVAYEFLASIILDPTFPEDELETERKRVKTSLEFELSDPGAMANRHFDEVVYGHHPYAIEPVVETVEAVSRDDIAAFHAKNYVPNNAILFVVGDVKAKNVKKAIKKRFGGWEKGTPDSVEFPEPPARTARNIALYHRPGSVQANVYVGHLGMRPNDPDWPAVTVGNRVLGAGATGRLFLHLREEKGWTYGAYSSFSKSRDVGYFRATANVRSEVTDSALTALVDEIRLIATEPVSQQELEDAKSYLIGNFPTTIETPDQIARQIGQVKLLGLGDDYLKTYRKNIAKVSVEDVQTAMARHVFPDRLAMVLVGDANEIKDKVDPIAAVTLYDIEGNPMSMSELAVQPSDYDFDTSKLEDQKNTYAVIMREMNLGDLEVEVQHNAAGNISAKSTISGMISMSEEMELGVNNFEPLAYSFSMAAGPQQMKASYTFGDGNVKGTIEGMPDGPKDVDVDLVDGTLIMGSLDIALSTLPLAIGKTFTFPVLDGQSGTLQSAKIRVVGEENLAVPAGSFTAYKVQVKRAEGESIYYCRKEAPHLLVKQEMPAQSLSIELKTAE